MKSICIKTNNSNFLCYLRNELKYIDIQDICFSENSFKNYDNIIIHYKGNDEELFLNKISSILSYLVIDEEEDNLLKRIILSNYFYFDYNEQQEILDICFDFMCDELSSNFYKKYNILFKNFYEFLSPS